MSNKRVIINLFYGKLPDIFQLSLTSYGYNKTCVDFILVVNDLEGLRRFKIPENVTIIELTSDLIKKMEDFTKVKIDLSKPTEFCGIKCIFGSFFKEEIKNYDYWGWIDYDVILSDLNDYFKNIDKDYDVITIKRYHTYGVLILYKNIEWISDAWMRGENSLIKYYEEKKYLYGYDEFPNGFMYKINKNTENVFFGSNISDICNHVDGKQSFFIKDKHFYDNSTGLKTNCFIADNIFKYLRYKNIDVNIFVDFNEIVFNIYGCGFYEDKIKQLNRVDIMVDGVDIRYAL